MNFMELTKNFKDHNGYRNIRAAGGGIVWSSAIKINLSHFVLLGRQIKDMSSGESLGYWRSLSMRRRLTN